MTNPNNAVGTNAAYGGRTSVKAFNDVLSALSSGILSGWTCSPDTGMGVVLGGNGSTRDVAIAVDNVGNKTTINNIPDSPISVVLPSAPVANSRIDSIVAYVDNPPQGSNTVTDNPSACGLIVVSGTSSVSPIAPDDNTIRTAITADGASGVTAFYVVLANITVASGTSTITSQNIMQGAPSVLKPDAIGDGSITNSKLATVLGDYSLSEVDTGCTWIDGSKIYKKTVDVGTLPNATIKYVNHNITNLKAVVHVEGVGYSESTNNHFPLPFPVTNSQNTIWILIHPTQIEIGTGVDRSGSTGYVTIFYTKTS